MNCNSFVGVLRNSDPRLGGDGKVPQVGILVPGGSELGAADLILGTGAQEQSLGEERLANKLP